VPNRDLLFSSVEIMVVSSDGYSYAKDTFTININNISFIYLLNIIVSSIASVLGFCGIFKYRSFFHRLFCKKKYKYSFYKIGYESKF